MVTAIVACACVAGGALSLPADEPLELTGSVGAWFTRITGTAQVGSAGTPLSLVNELAVDENNAGVAGEFAVAAGRWRFGGLGFWASNSGDAVAPTAGTFGSVNIAVGDQLQGSYSAWMAGGEVQYCLWRPTADAPFPWDAAGTNGAEAAKYLAADGHRLFDVQLLLLGGALGTHYEQTLTDTTAGTSSGFNQTVASVYAGAGLDVRMDFDGRVPLLRGLRVYAEAGAGPTIPGGQLMWMVRVGFEGMVTPNIGAEFGYRLFDVNLVDGPSQVDLGLRGLFAGLAVRF